VGEHHVIQRGDVATEALAAAVALKVVARADMQHHVRVDGTEVAVHFCEVA